MFKKLLFALLTFTLIPTCAFAADVPSAQSVKVYDTQASGNLAGANQAVTIVPNGQGSLVFSITGTFSGTIVPEASVDGTNYSAISAVSVTSGVSTQAITTTGAWFATAPGFSSFRIRESIYTSGTAIVTVRASVAGNGVNCISGCIPTSYVASTTAGTNIVQTGTALNPVISTSLTPLFTSLTDSGLVSGQCAAVLTNGLFGSTGFSCGTTSSATFVIPSVNGTVSVNTTNPVTFAKYTPITITDGTNEVIGYVNSAVSNATSFTFFETSVAQGAVGNTMATAAEIIVSGGATYSAGSNLTLTSGTFALTTSPSTTGNFTANSGNSAAGIGFYAGGGGTFSDNGRALDATNNNGNNTGEGPDNTHTASTITGTCWNWAQYSGASFNNELGALDCSGNLGLSGTLHATTLYGSGAGLTSGTVPNAALTTTPLTSLTAGTAITITGTAPTQTVAVSTNPALSGNVTGGSFQATGASGSRGIGTNGGTSGTDFGFYASGTPNVDHPNSLFVYNSNSTQNTIMGTDSTATVNGVVGTCWSVYDSTASTSTVNQRLTTNDCAGNMGVAGALHAGSFYGSGTGLTAGTVPNSALVTTPLTGLTAGLNTSVTGSAPNQTVATVTNPTFTGGISVGVNGTAAAGVNFAAASGNTVVQVNGSQTVATIAGTALNVNNGSSSYLSLDQSGNLGIAGQYVTGVANGTPTSLWLDTNANEFGAMASSTGISANGVTCSLWCLSRLTAPAQGYAGTFFSVDTSGNVGVAGSMNAVNSTVTQRLTLGSNGYEWLHTYSNGCGTLNWYSNGTGVASSNATGLGITCASGSTNLLALSSGGSLGILGSYSSGSSRKLKNNIVSMSDDKAMDIIRKTNMVKFCYKVEHCAKGQEKHIGFIAEDTPIDIAPNHVSEDLNAVANIALQGDKINDRHISQLELQVKILEVLVGLLLAGMIVAFVLIIKLIKRN